MAAATAQPFVVFWRERRLALCDRPSRLRVLLSGGAAERRRRRRRRRRKWSIARSGDLINAGHNGWHYLTFT